MLRQLGMGVAVAAVALGAFSSNSANAEIFDIAFTSANFSVSAEVTAVSDNGNFDVTSISSVSTVTDHGVTFGGLNLVTTAGTPPGVGTLNVPNGFFTYDDVIFVVSPLQFDINGLLFQAANGQYYNLFTNNSPNDSIAFTVNGGIDGSNFTEGGTGSITAVVLDPPLAADVPEPSTWAMML